MVPGSNSLSISQVPGRRCARAGIRGEAVLLEAGAGARGDQAGALRHDDQLVAGHGMARARLAARNVGNDEAPHRHEGQPAAVDLDDAHFSARVGMLVDLHKSQALVGHARLMLLALGGAPRPALPQLDILPSARSRVLSRVAASQASFAMSRSLNFWILPVEVLGSSVNTTRLGHLKRASFSLQ